MTKNILKSISILVILSFFITIHTPVFASQLDDYRKQQKSLNTQINSVKNKIKQTETKKKATLNDIDAINKNIQQTNNELVTLDNKLDIAQKNINTAQKEISEKEKEVEERTEILEERLCDIYIQGDVNILEVLFQSTNISEFLTRFELLKSIAENDTELLTTLEQERKILDTKKRKLEAVKKDIAYLKSSRESKKEELRMASINKQELVKVLDTEKKSYEQGLNDIEKQSRQITSQIQKLQSSSSGSKPSNMLWPTPGYTRITSPYGWRNHPILNSKRFHTGIDIAAPHGANAVAVASGKVIFVGWNGAYGNTVIIDHGGGISTLYAHLSSFIVSTGTQVSVNQSVARIGSTGWSTGPHLHFEVRNNGNHINPYSFLK